MNYSTHIPIESLMKKIATIFKKTRPIHIYTKYYFNKSEKHLQKNQIDILSIY